ncbi:9115_t:CDS:10 [Ambispora gerdemannii]|uniref:9115_t:CDS:1 n=1 Tax=Ambispora gerdemannii TaxID=144530 RepID=A0A9N9AP16_9GLOM|nr:9115_t:CDS:10 [Ambispora gerdemannii]
MSYVLPWSSLLFPIFDLIRRLYENRTGDLLLTRQTLCQLSQEGISFDKRTNNLILIRSLITRRVYITTRVICYIFYKDIMSNIDVEILELAGDEQSNDSPEQETPKITGKRKKSPSESEGESSDHEVQAQEEKRKSKRMNEDKPILPQEEEDDAMSYDSDLMGDEDDRERLLEMTEVEREKILSERAERRQQKYDLNLVTRWADSGPKKEGDSTRRSTRAKDGTKKSTKYSELKRAREEKGQKKAQSSANNNNDNTSNHKLDLSDLAGRLSMRESSPQPDRILHREFRQPKFTGDELKFEDLKSIQITRRQIEKWMFDPFFEKTVIGCFVRLHIGMKENGTQIYRVRKHHRNYKVENTLTNKSMLLRHGKDQKVWTMDIISNASFEQSEYDRWVSTMKFYGRPFPSKNDVEKRREAIQEAYNYNLTEEDVASIVAQKNQLRGSQTNLVAEKHQLLTRSQIAQSENKFAEVAEIAAKIEEIDSYLNEQAKLADKNLYKWAQLNEKNRRKNLEDSRAAEARAKAEKAAKLKLKRRVEELGHDTSTETVGESSTASTINQPSKSPFRPIAPPMTNPIHITEEVYRNLKVRIVVKQDKDYEKIQPQYLQEMKYKYEITARNFK